MARPTQGTTVHLDSDTAAPTYATQLVCPNSISDVGGGEASEIDVTTLCSTAKEYRLGLTDEGTQTWEMPWDPTDAGQALLKTHRDSGDPLAVKITVPADGGDPAVELTFIALVKQFKKDLNTDDVVRGTAVIRVTGGIAEA